MIDRQPHHNKFQRNTGRARFKQWVSIFFTRSILLHDWA